METNRSTIISIEEVLTHFVNILVVVIVDKKGIEKEGHEVLVGIED